MLNKIYSYRICFVGGETQNLLFRLLTKDGQEFNANGCEVVFSIIDYQNNTGKPLLIKDAEIIVTDDGVPNIASVVLLPEDSVDMYGRYIGQLSLRDGDGEVEIHKGTIDITNNTHHAFVER